MFVVSTSICRDKHVFDVTELLLRQKLYLLNFVAIKDLLCHVCHDKTFRDKIMFVVTKSYHDKSCSCSPPSLSVNMVLNVHRNHKAY